MQTLFAKLAAALTAILALLLPHPQPHLGGTPTLTTIKCNVAFQGPLFDTPSGHMEKGYYDASKTTPAVNTATTSETLPAHALGGTAAWKECIDANGYTHEVQISNAEYASYGVKNATIPAQDVLATTTSPVN